MEQVEQPNEQVAQLLGARMPADRGLAGLGLIMRLAGSIFVAYGAYVAVMPVAIGSMGGKVPWAIFLIGVLSAIRSSFHGAAGRTLLYGSPQGPLYGVKRYIKLALVQSVIVVLLLGHEDAPGKLQAYVFLLLVAWPVTLAILLQHPRYKNLDEGLPHAEDMGFESAAVLMSILGMTGVTFGGFVLFGILKSKFLHLSDVPTLIWTMVVAMLFARSLLHLNAGIMGTKGVDSEGASQRGMRYVNFGFTSSIIAGAVLLVQFMMLPGSMNMMVLVTVGVVTYLLLAWPLILRNFFTDRNFSMLLAGEETPNYRRAPDSGLTALGWLLVATGSFALVQALADVFLSGGGGMAGSLMPMGNSFGSEMGNSPWWSVGISGMQLWAGLELIAMSDRHKLAATVFGAVASAATIYLYWPVIKMLTKHGIPGLSDMTSVLVAYTPLVLALIVPVASVILVNRAHLPDATARIREE